MARLLDAPLPSVGTFPGAHRSFLAVRLGLSVMLRAPRGLFLPEPYPSLLYLHFAEPRDFCRKLGGVCDISRC